MSHFHVGNRVRIAAPIDGPDDTPVGTLGTVVEIETPDVLRVELDGEWPDTNQYWTDGSNLELVP